MGACASPEGPRRRLGDRGARSKAITWCQHQVGPVAPCKQTLTTRPEPHTRLLPVTCGKALDPTPLATQGPLAFPSPTCYLGSHSRTAEKGQG